MESEKEKALSQCEFYLLTLRSFFFFFWEAAAHMGKNWASTAEVQDLENSFASRAHKT